MSQRPLSGVRVLDLTNVLAGPYCSYQLMLLGAEVVKIEVPGQGDLARHLGPDAELNRSGLGASFLAQNAGKKSIEVDLKDAADRADFEDMVRGADVLLENFRAGVLARLGFGWPRLRELNPGLVYCAISGFGQTGPMSQAPAYDQIIQGLSGMMSITGTKETAPLRIGFPVCDTVGGLTAALHIAAALAGRARTGQGTFLDVSMLESAVSSMGWAVSNYLVSGVPPEPMGTQNATAAPSGTFEAADGPLNIAANRQQQFETLCALIDRPDLPGDPRFTDRELRKLHREELTEELNRALRRRTAEEWERILGPAGVPAARVATVPQAVELEQLAHRGFFTELPFPDGSGRVLKVAGGGVLHDGEPLRPTAAPPLLGEQNSERGALRNRWSGSEDNAVTS
ncbi:CaiB/BaiF CoA transferase family protein [Actinomadura opuntiae]|uniref:CaiB/BaiF CoA transferase family protein n=1 Tax=Actinomadura sp. OS1-43 TaxID=604315 RepID=UPI00255B11E7|nr:CoA transferase [Actinomadura sp. OS1-43]MDL4814323.1 CoA transferase [Actinomadura sp. OS1-43]